MISINIKNRVEALKRMRYDVYDYTGALDKAPRSIRHLLRDLPKGQYVVNYHLNRVVPTPLFGDNKERIISAYTMAGHDLLAREGWLFYQHIVDDLGSRFLHFDVEPFSRLAVEANAATVGREPGFYAYKAPNAYGPFDSPIAIIDEMLLIHKPKLLDGLAEVQTASTALLELTEFPEGRGGVVTEGPFDKGLVVAFLPFTPYAQRVGRYAVLGDEMFGILYELAVSQYLSPKAVGALQNRARVIVGDINS